MTQTKKLTSLKDCHLKLGKFHMWMSLYLRQLSDQRIKIERNCQFFPQNIIENSCEAKTNYTLSRKPLQKLKINPTYSLDSPLEGFGIIKPFYR